MMLPFQDIDDPASGFDATAIDPLVPRVADLPTAVPLEPDADLSVLDEAKILAAPKDPADRPAWREALARWRTEARERISFSDSLYRDSRLQWAVRGTSVAIVWLWDERLFDHARGVFTVDALVDDAVARFGGFDAVVLWHAYPVIGVDERNQFDFYSGVADLAQQVKAFQARGVRVYLDYNPWDVGSRPAESDDAEQIADLLQHTGADGVFLDTLREGTPQLISALADLPGPVSLEGEVRLPLTRVADHIASWAQWMADTPAPGVLRAHWFERRHMMHHTRRWNRDHSEEIQSAWVNGCGMLIWEDVFGSWVGWSARDAATWKSVRVLQRHFWPLLADGDWVPLAELDPAAEAAGIYASAFTLEGTTLYTVINRGDTDYGGPIVADVAARVISPLRDGATVPAHGIAAVLVDPTRLWISLARTATGELAHSPDVGYPIRPATRRAPPALASPVGAEYQTADWVRIGGGARIIEQQFRLRETGTYDEIPFVEEWKPLPPRLHSMITRRSQVYSSPVQVAGYEVSNAEFADFVAASGYRPLDPNRFLSHFDGVKPLRGTESEPVTHVNLADARAFCHWHGVRLPTEFEWQLAATEPGFGRGRPRVWNWTESEHSNGTTRFAILKGGSDYQATASPWYFDGGIRPPEFAAKMLLAGRGMDRSSRIGFRVARDVPEVGDQDAD